jgi:hypothetical protein
MPDYHLVPVDHDPFAGLNPDPYGYGMADPGGGRRPQRANAALAAARQFRPATAGFPEYREPPSYSPAEEAAFHRGFYHGTTGAGRVMPETSLAERYKFERSPQLQGPSNPYGESDLPEMDLRRQLVPRDAFEAAALHTAGNVRGGAYDPNTTPATQEERQRDVIRAAGRGAAVLSRRPATTALAAGVLAGNELYHGDPERAAIEAGSALLPSVAGRFPKTAAAAVGTYLGATPEATGGGLIDSLLPAEQAAYKDRLRQANRIRDPDQRRAAVDGINREISTLVSGRADVERRMATEKQTADDWLKANDASISSLPTERAASVRGANPGDRPGLLRQFLDEKQRAGMTTAEKYAEYLDPARYALLGLSGLVPAKMAFSRAGELKTSVAEARAAWDAFNKGQKTRTKTAELTRARNDLAQAATLSPFDPREMALGATVPYAFTTFGPNAIDVGKNASAIPIPTWLGGSGESARPEDWEKSKRAMWAMAAGAPWPILEGGFGALGGNWAGGFFRDFGPLRKRANALLETIQQLPATSSRSASKAAQAQGNVLSGGSLGAATIPNLAPPTSSLPLTLPAASASKYPDWATTPALKRKYTMDQKKKQNP